MINAAPHYLLISESYPAQSRVGGRWRFVLESIGGTEKLVVADSEPNIDGERLQLLTVIRGLEALDQPSTVTLLTPSRYVLRGIRRGLPYWRENNWQWEKFGQMSAVKNADLWQRLDRALEWHQVRCRNLDRLASSVSPNAIQQDRPLFTSPSIQPSPINQETLSPQPPRTDLLLPLKNWFQEWTRTLSLIPTIIL